MTPALLVFDGDCGFCTTTVDRLRAVLPRFPEAQPWQRLDLASLDLTIDDVTTYAWLVDRASGRRWHGAQTFAALLRGQRGALPRLAGAVLAAPGVRDVAALGYDWISAHRHELPGGTPACALPAPDAKGDAS
ncbi:thiol-disulfide oxidoreductase DCC family protein [Agrococcus jejuensis]|uniref:Predicted thiol-disulfide oxidoreductase YuxK, DCC family n=1 Tax=Agrococcus jejuensis TaxID=399736 RepID=A0A1G8G5C6_9MICO|nr:DCC1-like thiol-disulfide oxidoreductase family protein [Agrococcus jejuensis]SDH89471.1 Predicted thiol-disulfide oxidoreductase YuxK, DCC family [Agrococcus jejuensis]